MEQAVHNLARLTSPQAGPKELISRAYEAFTSSDVACGEPAGILCPLVEK